MSFGNKGKDKISAFLMSTLGITYFHVLGEKALSYLSLQCLEISNLIVGRA